MIFDCFLYSGEAELLKARIEILNSTVDYFIITESTQAFSGKEKKASFAEVIFPENVKSKIIYQLIQDKFDSAVQLLCMINSAEDEDDIRIREAIKGHDYYNKDQLHWLLEAYHRERLISPLNGLAKEQDIVFVSDVDEIPDLSKSILENLKKDLDKGYTLVFSHSQYQYRLDCKCKERWSGLYASYYGHLTVESLNSIRASIRGLVRMERKHITIHSGWHLTNFGTIEDIKAKVRTYGHQEYNNPLVHSLLPLAYWLGYDYLFRPTQHYELSNPSLDAEINDSLRTSPWLTKQLSERSRNHEIGLYARKLLKYVFYPASLILYGAIAASSKLYKHKSISRKRDK